MAVGRKFAKYRLVLEKLKLRQLDVYRYKDHDELRLQTPDKRIIIVKLPRKREEMSIEEFEEAIRKALSQAKGR